jgi:hypothetical protein
MPKVRAGNITLNYDQQGSGEPLVLIPTWRPITPVTRSKSPTTRSTSPVSRRSARDRRVR